MSVTTGVRMEWVWMPPPVTVRIIQGTSDRKTTQAVCLSEMCFDDLVTKPLTPCLNASGRSP